MPIGLSVDVGWPWWVITTIACGIVVVGLALLVLSRSSAVRAVAGLLALEGAVIAIVAPFVMSDMSSNDSAMARNAAMSSHSSGTVIHVVEHAPPPHMRMFGAVETFANPIFDSRDAKPIGRDQGFCVHIPLTKTPECLWTTLLPGGEITAEGPLSDTAETPIAITGGTGKYQNARGWLQEKVHNKAGTKFDVFFHLSS